VVQNYIPSSEILELLEEYRLTTSESIRIGINENLTSMKSLSSKVCRRLSQHSVAACYRLAAISRAARMGNKREVLDVWEQDIPE
jgi:hypothetical protein